MARNLLVINVDFKETRVALIEEGVIAELQIERVAHRSTVGNIVLGRVTRVLPGMQAAFIDVGQERAAFLHVEDLIRPNDFDAYLASDAREKVKLKSAEATEDDPSEDESEEGAAPAEVALPADAIEAAGRTTRRGRRRRGRRGRGRDRLSPAGESDVAGPAEGSSPDSSLDVLQATEDASVSGEEEFPSSEDAAVDFHHDHADIFEDIEFGESRDETDFDDSEELTEDLEFGEDGSDDDAEDDTDEGPEDDELETDDDSDEDTSEDDELELEDDSDDELDSEEEADEENSEVDTEDDELEDDLEEDDSDEEDSDDDFDDDEEFEEAVDSGEGDLDDEEESSPDSDHPIAAPSADALAAEEVPSSSARPFSEPRTAIDDQLPLAEAHATHEESATAQVGSEEVGSERAERPSHIQLVPSGDQTTGDEFTEEGIPTSGPRQSVEFTSDGDDGESDVLDIDVLADAEDAEESDDALDTGEGAGEGDAAAAEAPNGDGAADGRRRRGRRRRRRGGKESPVQAAAAPAAVESEPTAPAVASNDAESNRKRRRRGRRRGGNGRAEAKAPSTTTEITTSAPSSDAARRVPLRVSRSVPITEVVKEGDLVVVQISKEPIGTKGARVTSHVSLPGRYVVYLPTVDHIGISKRIGNARERARLRKSIEAIKPANGGLIVRTVAEGLTKKQLKADIGYLIKVWADVAKRRETAKPAEILYEELDLVLKAARDLFTDEVQQIVIDDREQHGRLCRFVEMFMPNRVKDIKLYTGEEPIFDAYGIEDEIKRALSRKVPLPSGGSLIMDQAEALTAIDVNTGRYVGKGSKDLEETALKTNLEAVDEIAYQLRFRNIGGLVILDLIDMEKADNREKVWRALEQKLAKDKAKTTINRISDLGLIEMTRKRTRESLGRIMHEACFYCDGTGNIQSRETIAYEILRQIRRDRMSLTGYSVRVLAHPAVVDFLKHEARDALQDAERRYMRRIELVPKQEYHVEQYDLQGR